MTSSPDLFNIIKSLTPSEKRYFKIYASRHVIGNKNNYEKLYDALDALPDDKPYDEAAFKKSMKGKTWIKNLAVEKNQLEDLLLKAMRNYHSEKTEEGKLDNELANLRFLYDKGLIDAAGKVLSKATELATNQQNLLGLIEVYEHKLEIEAKHPKVFSEYKEDPAFKRESQIFDMLLAQRKLGYISKHVYSMYINGLLSKNTDAADNILKELGEIEQGIELTLNAKIIAKHVQALVYEKTRDFEKAAKLYEELIDLWESKDPRLKTQSQYFLKILGNYLVCMMQLERFENFLPTIQKMSSIPAKTYREQATIFIDCNQFRLLYFLNTDSNKESLKIATEIEKGLDKYGALITLKQTVNLRQNICLLYLKHHDFNNLVAAISKVYEVTGRDESYKNMIRDLKFIEIMAQICLKQFSVADYLIVNTDRWLRDNKLKNEFTALLTQIFKAQLKPGATIKTNEQLANANCPPDMMMLKELLISWF